MADSMCPLTMILATMLREVNFLPFLASRYPLPPSVLCRPSFRTKLLLCLLLCCRDRLSTAFPPSSQLGFVLRRCKARRGIRLEVGLMLRSWVFASIIALRSLSRSFSLYLSLEQVIVVLYIQHHSASVSSKTFCCLG